MKHYETSNKNYTIDIPDTQQDFLNLKQDLIPRQVEELDATYYTYAPSRNMKVKGVMRHSETI